MAKTMRVAITGATGNVGTSVLRALSDEPDVTEIVGIARRAPRDGGAHGAKVSWRAADISCDPLEPILEGVDAVIHLAWLIQPSHDLETIFRTNVEGSLRVFDATGAVGAGTLLYASSVGAYAPSGSEDAVDERWPVTGIPSSFYSRHKAIVEGLLDAFERDHPQTRVVRLRPALIFKRSAASEIRRLFAGPLLPGRLLQPELLPLLPFPRGLRTQVVHSHDVGEGFRLALRGEVNGAFNLAADPPLDARLLESMFEAKVIELPPRPLRAVASASWRARLQPSPPGWLDLGLQSPIMDTARAREQLQWSPTAGAEEILRELLSGLREGTGETTPPLDPDAGGRLRWREVRRGIGGGSR